MKYKIIAEATIKKLVEVVNEHMQDRWRPIGGIAINETGYAQAMIKQVSI